ncbi:hypothetical protein D8674_025615 [Pyrus ussuriensis x Pyrus communis]|uniref:Uncharacterized protein n=1 Tax=Pyrus ussuriensis x Pyrus communis TaxID=2448454 RepID=A0A5N5I932_9ROSA|nr:hypothetical protein D8674_025615 [Pyrus ussuriensis x Pyrus communis]
MIRRAYRSAPVIGRVRESVAMFRRAIRGEAEAQAKAKSESVQGKNRGQNVTVNGEYKESTITVIELENGDVMVVSDSRRTKKVDLVSRVVHDNVNKVHVLNGNVVVAGVGNMQDSTMGAYEMKNTIFKKGESHLKQVINKGIEYINNLTHSTTLGYLILGVEKKMSGIWYLSYSKNDNEYPRRKLKVYPHYHAFGSGAKYICEYLEISMKHYHAFGSGAKNIYEYLGISMKHPISINEKAAQAIAEFGHLIASLMDPATGGYIMVQLVTENGVKVLSLNNVLALLLKYYDRLEPLFKRCIFIVYKTKKVFDPFGKFRYIEPDVNLDALRMLIEGKNGERGVIYMGHPMFALEDSYYLQMVLFEKSKSVASAMKKALDVSVNSLPFASNLAGIKFLDVEGKKVYIMPSTKSNLANMKPYLPPIDFSL